MAFAGPVDVAKTEFDRYCREITGGEPPKATFAVDAKLDALHDEYRIVSEGEGVRFVGANERAVLFAVYDFLSRRGGCKWFWDGDIVPRKEKIDCAGLAVRVSRAPLLRASGPDALSGRALGTRGLEARD